MVFSCTVVQMDVSWCGHRALKMPVPHCAGVISYLLSFHHLFSAYIILYPLDHWGSPYHSMWGVLLVWEQRVYGNSLYQPFNFAVNLKLL